MLVSISATNCDEAYHIVDCASFPIESLALRWHFITSVVSTEKYNVNSILCQCTMVVIGKCQTKLPIVLHVMVIIEVREVKK